MHVASVTCVFFRLTVTFHLVAERAPGTPLAICLLPGGFIDVPAIHGWKLVNRRASSRISRRRTIVWRTWITNCVSRPSTNPHLHTGNRYRCAQVEDVARSMCAMTSCAVQGRVSAWMGRSTLSIPGIFQITLRGTAPVA